MNFAAQMCPHVVSKPALALVALTVQVLRQGTPPDGSGLLVASLEGTLLVERDGRMSLVAEGDRIDPGLAARTARGSRASLRLADGSVVEVGETPSSSR